MHSPITMLVLLALPSLAGLIVALAKLGWAERLTERFCAWTVAKRAALRGTFRSWGQDVAYILIWPFQGLAGLTGKIPQTNWRAGVRITVFSYTALLLTAVVAALLYIVVIVTLAVLALYFGFKVVMHFLTEGDKEGESRSVRESASSSSQRGFWSSNPEEASGTPDSAASASGPRGTSSFWTSTRPCRACQATMSTDIEICPKCGEDQRTWKPLGTWERQCRVCGQTVSEDVEVCRRCGENQETWKPLGTWEGPCRACGTTVSEDVDVCPQCGENKTTWKPLGAWERKCRVCGGVVSEDVEVCHRCGENQGTWKPLGTWERACRACNAIVSEDVDHCPQCGEDLAAFKLF